MFIIRVISFVYHLANTTSLGFILIIAIVICVLSRYFRLKQPNLPQNLIDAIGSNQHIDRQCLTGQVNQRCHASDALEWWPIANRAASLDSIENSRSAIEKVSHNSYSGKLKKPFNIYASIHSLKRYN